MNNTTANTIILGDKFSPRTLSKSIDKISIVLYVLKDN